MIERVVVVAAHPDDAETGAGGTVAALVRQGAEVTYVIAQNPHRTYNLFASHRDHRIVGGAVLDCVYPREIYIVKWQEEAHHIAVDISETMDLKLRAIACHQSQFPDFPAMEARVRERCAALGRPHGYAYAETFDRMLLAR